jgi:WD40 repeat protein/transcriptional regulator with XRE-family HTH domain
MSVQPFSLDSFQTFGDLLKYLRRRERLTQLELSILVGYSEAQIGRLEKNQRRPDLTALNALFIPALHLDHDPKLCARFMELAHSARQEDTPTPGIAPYKGLLFFDESDSELFFGRETLTDRLAERVTDLAVDASMRFLAIVGASGSGKSSLVRAGLAVALKRAGWDTRVFTPTTNPVKILEANLNMPHAINSERGLFLVDQFEEVFTLCRDEHERNAFIEKLLSLSVNPSPILSEERSSEGQITVVIALRADFYSYCAQYPSLRQAVAAQQEYIGQMTTKELRRAIEEPARRGGWEFELGLIDVLLHDIGADSKGEPEPGALPLLSHALLATWDNRRGRTLTLDGYHASGGVRGAIAETAESIFTDQLNQRQQELARDVFLRLTELGEGMEDTRRRAILRELVNQPQEATQLRAVLNMLAEARLITLNEDSAEVAHEALIREWGRLREWLTQDREGLKLHRHLTEAAHEWEVLKHDVGALYRGARLAQAREWATVNSERLNPSERDFLAASFEQEQHETMEREEQRQRELEAAQKLAKAEKARAEEQLQSVRRLRQRAVYLFVALSVAVITAILAGVFANRNGTLATANAFIAATAQAQANLSATQQAEAQANFIRAEAQRLAGDANNLLNSNGSSELIALLSLRSMKIQYSPQGDAALAGAATLNYPRQLYAGDTREVTSVAFSSNDRYIFTGSLDGTARLWEMQTGNALQQFRPKNISNPGPVTWVAISPDDHYLLTMSNSRIRVSSVITLWDIETGNEALTFFTSSVPNVAVFSRDGRYVFTGLNDSVVEVFDLQTRRLVSRYFLPTPALSVLHISPDGKYAITRTTLGEGTVQLWGLDETVTKLQEFIYGAVVSGAPQNVAISPDGKSVLIGYVGGSTVMWDIASGEILQIFYGHEAGVRSVTFSPDGNSVLTGGLDKTSRMWSVQTGAELLRLNTSGIVNSVAFSSDGQSVLTGCADGTVQLWDAHARPELPVFTNGNANTGGVSLSAVAFSPDGKFLATGGTDGLKLWNVETGQLQRAFANSGYIKYGVRFSADGRSLLSGNWSSGVASLWDVQTGKQLQQFILPTRINATDTLNDVVFSSDGKSIVSATGHIMNVWDRQTGDLIIQDGTFGIITRLAFSPDSRYLLTASTAGQVKLFDAQIVMLINRLVGAAALNGATFSPDGKYIATASVDKLAHLWDVESGKEIRQYSGHTDILYSVAFSPDGKYIVTTSADGTARLWDVQTGQELRRFTGHTAGVQNVAFSPDGKFIATVSDDGTARLWDIDYHTTMNYLCSILLRDFTDAERAQYNITDHKPTCPP